MLSRVKTSSECEYEKCRNNELIAIFDSLRNAKKQQRLRRCVESTSWLFSRLWATYVIRQALFVYLSLYNVKTRRWNKRKSRQFASTRHSDVSCRPDMNVTGGSSSMPAMSTTVQVWLDNNVINWNYILTLTRARMSKITNDSLTRSGTGCFIAVPTATVCVVGLTRGVDPGCRGLAPPQYFAKGAMHQSGPSNN